MVPRAVITFRFMLFPICVMTSSARFCFPRRRRGRRGRTLLPQLKSDEPGLMGRGAGYHGGGL